MFIQVELHRATIIAEVRFIVKLLDHDGEHDQLVEFDYAPVDSVDLFIRIGIDSRSSSVYL
jgi:hypothetical protein